MKISAWPVPVTVLLLAFTTLSASPASGQAAGTSPTQDSATKPAPTKSPTADKDAAAAKDPALKPQGNADDPENYASLMLTDDQKARIKAIRDDSTLQIAAAQKDKTLTDEQKERRIKEIRKATRAQVFAVLTPDQQKTWSYEQRQRREAKSAASKKP
jgi:Spy/CpxP family protein refolding chaperone